MEMQRHQIYGLVTAFSAFTIFVLIWLLPFSGNYTAMDWLQGNFAADVQTSSISYAGFIIAAILIGSMMMALTSLISIITKEYKQEIAWVNLIISVLIMGFIMLFTANLVAIQNSEGSTPQLLFGQEANNVLALIDIGMLLIAMMSVIIIGASTVTLQERRRATSSTNRNKRTTSKKSSSIFSENADIGYTRTEASSKEDNDDYGTEIGLDDNEDGLPTTLLDEDDDYYDDDYDQYSLTNDEYDDDRGAYRDRSRRRRKYESGYENRDDNRRNRRSNNRRRNDHRSSDRHSRRSDGRRNRNPSSRRPDPVYDDRVPPRRNRRNYDAPDVYEDVATAYLTMISPGNETFEIMNHETRIGRSRVRDNDIILDDPKVSREHAVIEQHNGNYIIREVATGTVFLNGRRIRVKEKLRDRDEIRLGDTILSFSER